MQTDVFTMRSDLERQFVNNAVAAIAAGTHKAQDLTTLVQHKHIANVIQRAIWRAVEEMAAAGRAIDVVTLWEHIYHARDKQQKEKTGGEPWPKEIRAAHIAEVATSIYALREDVAIAQAIRVREEGIKRQMEIDLLSMVTDCKRYGNDPAELCAGLHRMAEEAEGVGMDNCDMSSLLARVISSLESGKASKPLPTPWENLNAVLKGGLVAGELAILAARPGMGKTALAGCMAVETARMGIPVLFVSREVKDTTLASRMLAREGRIDNRVFRQGVEHVDGALPRIKAAASSLKDLPLRIVEKSVAPMSPREVRRLAKGIKGIGLVIVDYLQLLCPDTPSQSREREVAEMSRSMKQLALDCDCPVLLLSQLNRRAEEGDREPQLSDLRESGAIEQDADIVIFLHANKPDKSQSKTPVQANVAKGRSSGTGKAYLIFDKPFANFDEDLHAQEWADSTNRFAKQQSQRNDL